MVSGILLPLSPVPGKLVGAGNFEQRIPVHRGIKLRGGSGGRGGDRLEVEHLAGARFLLGGILQAVAAYPDFVVRIRKIGDDKAALIVCYDHLGVFGRKVFGFRDRPDAGFGAIGADHLAADVVCGDVDRGGPCGARRHQRAHSEPHRGDLFQIHFSPRGYGAG
jgi:hypothetical protein